jgi:hypothetical protein
VEGVPCCAEQPNALRNQSALSPTLRDTPDHLVYEPLEAPDVEVEVDGQWWPGQARMRTT